MPNYYANFLGTMPRHKSLLKHHHRIEKTKKFIVTITPNPALDLGGIVENLVPNEKSYVHNQTIHPGGNAINVARILTRLKTPVIATGFLGGSAGLEIKNLLDQESVNNDFITIKNKTRINVTVSNNFDHKQTRLSFPGPVVSPVEIKRLFHWIENHPSIELLVIGGSLPKGFTTDHVKKIIRLGHKKNIKTLVDIPGHMLKNTLSENPYFIKPNLEEFHELVENTRVKTIKEVIIQAKKFLDCVPLICVSSVEGGTLLISKSEIYFGKISHITVRSTVGAGDSLVGAISSSLFKKESSLEKILKWGLAASAATLSETGTSLGSLKKIKELYLKTKVSQIKF